MILINDLKRHNSFLAGEIKEALNKVVDSGWYVLGNEVKQFEAEFSKYIGTAFCVGVGNGTDALEIALKTLSIKQGDIVITVANAGMYSSSAIYAAGAMPLYVDIDLATFTMSVEALENSLHKSVKAIIVTHLYGQMARIKEIVELAQKRKIPVIEDCAQAHGAEYENKKAGCWGDIGCFSFYPTKNLGALGDGGAIVTKNPEYAQRAQMLRQYGWNQKYNVVIGNGKNSRLDELQAAVLRKKLVLLNNWNIRRREIAKKYISELCKLDIAVPKNMNIDYVAHLFVIRVLDRKNVINELNKKDIACEIHYPIPDYRQGPYIQNFKNMNLPNTEKACQEILTLPCYPELSNTEVEYILDSIKVLFRNQKRKTVSPL